jgi:hypothetical protein
MFAGVSVVEVTEEKKDDDGKDDAAQYDYYNLEGGWLAWVLNRRTAFILVSPSSCPFHHGGVVVLRPGS